MTLMVVQLTDTEKKILLAVNEKGQTNETDLAKAVGVDVTELSRMIGVLRDDKGAIVQTKSGQERIISLSDSVAVEGNDIYVSEGMPFPLGQKLQGILSDVVTGKMKKLIPRIVDAFRAQQSYQTPNGLRLLLTTWGIEPLTQNAIVDAMFPGQGGALGQGGPTYGGGIPFQQGQGFPYQMLYGPNGQPIIIMNPGGQQYAGQPIIVAGQPPQQPGQTIVVDSGQKRQIKRPMLDDKGAIKKDSNNEPLYEVVEEPITMQVPQGSSGGSSLKEAAEVLKSLAETGKAVGAIPNQQAGGKTEHEKELEARLEAMEKQNKETLEALRKANDEMRDKMFAKQIEEMKKDMDDRTEGLKSYIARLSEDNAKDRQVTLQIAQLQRDSAVQTATLQAQIEAAKSSGGTVDERLLDKGVSKVKEAVGGSLLDVYRIARASGANPALPPEAVAPQDAAAQLARMRQGA